jgi:hypothetical protein
VAVVVLVGEVEDAVGGEEEEEAVDPFHHTTTDEIVRPEDGRGEASQEVWMVAIVIGIPTMHVNVLIHHGNQN